MADSAGGNDTRNHRPSAYEVGRAVAAVNPYGVDVTSGVENPVGRKDPEKVMAFIEAVSEIPDSSLGEQSGSTFN